MEVVQTDNGKEFSGDEKGQYDHFCQEERIFHRRGADYTPQHQGQGERANRTVKRLLRKTGQLEMHTQQEGGEEGEREEREEAERDSEPRRGARRLLKREEREDREGVPPSPVAEDVEVDWGVDSDGNTLRAQEDREEVQAAQDDEEKKEALRECLGKLKEELARVIVEKEKKRRPLPRIVPVDPTVVEKMMSHVNPRKGHIDATNEEVESGSHEKGMLDELQRFLDETVFRWGVRVPKRRKVMRCRWVLTWKLKGGKRVAKARLVVKGFQDDRKDLQTYLGTAD
uniref:Integrase catalytic domain-containing protein n=1 Tax=Chromera velia CCMP2878 TaxID=1169474 RepID=A0A0G4HDN9_9ALVE|eukprot:Cvel_26437.t1-p1 / transcript=Cvel_26437.t1 / gene=Cvel_26437 / organism=Chromera_velia_CCMP2878 / gene_product=hypothetical protein / transcript_product=hypothetical protein / location=Cvel_scaffold3141:12904-15293(-) / protein_length=284 / sequence_SO=supercontig / SO=protein_coding / is_pseudo=false